MSLAAASGDDFVGQNAGETEDGQDVLIRQFSRGTFTYAAVGSTAWPNVQLEGSFDIAEALAANRAAADGGQRQQVHVDQATLTQAQRDLRDSIDDDEVRSIRAGLVDAISQDALGVALRDADDGPFVTGFQVTARLYPYDDTVTVADYDPAAQTVVNATQRGKEYLLNAYGIDDHLGDNRGGPRMFQ